MFFDSFITYQTLDLFWNQLLEVTYHHVNWQISLLVEKFKENSKEGTLRLPQFDKIYKETKKTLQET